MLCGASLSLADIFGDTTIELRADFLIRDPRLRISKPGEIVGPARGLNYMSSKSLFWELVHIELVYR